MINFIFLWEATCIFIFSSSLIYISMPTDWSSLIDIDRSWHSNQLEQHFDEIEGLARVKVYTVKVAGALMTPDGLVADLHRMVAKYVYSQKTRNQMGAEMAGLTANHFFGKTDPTSDGKFGELLLFALVEGVLGCKMVAHKIRDTTNRSDQAKGGDGVFMGSYQLSTGESYQACLIGESKIIGSLSKGLESAFESINRFHAGVRASGFRTTEYIVARENLLEDERVDFEEVYDRLVPGTEGYRTQILVHPILIMFNSASIDRCLKSGIQLPPLLEAHIKTELAGFHKNFVQALNKKLTKYPECATVQLHFFLIPYDEVDKFRDAMYQAIHGIPYS